MIKKLTNINYDQTGDVLYIVFGENAPSYSDELADCVFARYNLETDELVGITIINFSQMAKSDLINLISQQDISRDELKRSFDSIH